MQFRNHQKRRLHEEGVGPEMLSPAGLVSRIMVAPDCSVKLIIKLGIQ